MAKFEGTLIETDVLVIGAGAGGLLAAMSAKRHGSPGTRVTLVDAWMIGRRFETACQKLGLNKARATLDTEHFSPPLPRAQQLSLFA